ADVKTQAATEEQLCKPQRSASATEEDLRRFAMGVFERQRSWLNLLSSRNRCRAGEGITFRFVSFLYAVKETPEPVTSSVNCFDRFVLHFFRGAQFRNQVQAVTHVINIFDGMHGKKCEILRFQPVHLRNKLLLRLTGFSLQTLSL